MLEDVKLMLGLDDDIQDELIKLIIKITEQQFLLYTKSDTRQEKYDFIIMEITVERYNRLGSEGMERVTVEGHSIDFVRSDFDAYAHYIEELEHATGNERRGRVRFL